MVRLAGYEYFVTCVFIVKESTHIVREDSIVHICMHGLAVVSELTGEQHERERTRAAANFCSMAIN